MILGIPLHKQKYRVTENFVWNLKVIPVELFRGVWENKHPLLQLQGPTNNLVCRLTIPEDTVFELSKVNYTKTTTSYKIRIEFNLVSIEYKTLSNLKVFLS